MAEIDLVEVVRASSDGEEMMMLILDGIREFLANQDVNEDGEFELSGQTLDLALAILRSTLSFQASPAEDILNALLADMAEEHA